MSCFQRNRPLAFRTVFLLGLLLCLAVTSYIVAADKGWNFTIFRTATFDFWNGVVPYGQQWFRHGYDYYLYSPVFNVLFAPFAFLPYTVGVFAWNLFSYSLLAYAVYSFPRITEQQKAYTLLFLLPILGPSLMSCQLNIGVAALFVLAFSLLERGKPIPAIVLILVSGLTKVYGLAELSLLIFYPRWWRNAGYVLLFGVLIAALPLIRLGPAQYVEFFSGWIAALTEHNDTRTWKTVFDMRIIPWNGWRYVLMPYIQVGVFAVMAGWVLLKTELWKEFNFRIGVVGLIMGWCILFGSASETHTYLISVTGFLLWYHSLDYRPKLLRGLYWAVLGVVVLMPIDLLFPPTALDFVFHTLDLNKWLMLFLWVYMAVWIFDRRRYATRSA